MQRRWLNIRKGLLRMVLPAVRKLPPAAASGFVTGIGRAEYAMGKALRIRFDQAVSRGAAYFHATWDVSQVGRDLAGNQIRWRTRDQLLDGLSDATVDSLFEVQGREWLEEARSQNRGVILLGNHFGAHLMPAHWLVRKGYPLRLFMEKPHHISNFLGKQFDTDGPLGQKKLFISRKADPAEAAGAILRAGRVLKAGMIVLIAGDVRWSGPHTAPANFLGTNYRFSSTWVTLAAMTRAPVVPVFCRMGQEGRHHLEFLPPFTVPLQANSEGGTVPWVRECLERIEQRVKLHPENSNDYFFWDDEDDTKAVTDRFRRDRARPGRREIFADRSKSHPR